MPLALIRNYLGVVWLQQVLLFITAGVKLLKANTGVLCASAQNRKEEVTVKVKIFQVVQLNLLRFLRLEDDDADAVHAADWKE